MRRPQSGAGKAWKANSWATAFRVKEEPEARGTRELRQAADFTSLMIHTSEKRVIGVDREMDLERVRNQIQ